MGELDGRAALITGATTGIGRAIALDLAARGASVTIVDRDARAMSTARAILQNGGRARYCNADVTDPDSLQEAFRQHEEAFGALHLAVNNAGILDELVSLEEHSLEQFKKTMAVNLRGVFLALQAEIRAMKRAGGGAIINIASINGVRASSLSPIYSATKFGVLGLTRSAALEFAADKIRVNAVCPGAVDTPMLEKSSGGREAMHQLGRIVPLGRIAQPEDIARVVAWLASDESNYLTGQAVLADGGLSAIGGLA